MSSFGKRFTHYTQTEFWHYYEVNTLFQCLRSNRTLGCYGQHGGSRVWFVPYKCRCKPASTAHGGWTCPYTSLATLNHRRSKNKMSGWCRERNRAMFNAVCNVIRVCVWQFLQSLNITLILCFSFSFLVEFLAFSRLLSGDILESFPRDGHLPSQHIALLLYSGAC